MLLIFVNVIFVLVAIAMIVFILLQRGAGAQAGSGFGGGASATVFGARGSANFLSKATKWLAFVFLSICLGLAWYAKHSQIPVTTADAGIMGKATPAQNAPAPAVPLPSSNAVPAPQPAVPAPNAPTNSAAPAKPGNKGG
jgi:preprotein translocase subunit SecG